ncbi:MAG: CBS domain-containing protein [Actinobacteria bacterium]|nr:CBS domain-containing protein [Actinomycetota bacterium]
MGKESEKPLMFISHKHIDAKLAAIIKDFVLARTANKIRVYLSSDASSEGPAIGMNLDDELQNALWEASVVLLVYTLADYDWSFCMYECGVATDPKRPKTRVLVLQCGSDVPQPFADKVRIQASNPDDIDKFTRALLTDTKFFPDHGPVTDFSADSKVVADASADLFAQLSTELPEQSSANEWPVWPTIGVELGHAQVAEILDAPSDKQLDLVRDLVLEDGTVQNATPGAAMLFGKNELADGVPVQSLVDAWTEAYEDRPPGWLDSICAQVIIGAGKRKTSEIRWEAFREIGGAGRHLPGAGAVHLIPGEGRIRFDFHFLQHGVAQAVTSLMTRIDRIRKVNIDVDKPDQMELVTLVKDFEKSGGRRIPIVDQEDRPRYIVHINMIDRFIATLALAGDDVSALMLSDLLHDPEMGARSESTFVIVPQSATVSDAKATMDEANCRNVFVTENGTAEEPVLGWLTDRDIVEALDASLG